MSGKLYTLIMPVNDSELQVDTEYYLHELENDLEEMGVELSKTTRRRLVSGDSGTVIFDTDDKHGDFVIVIV